MPILTCEHVRIKYENREVISDVSFQINTGDYLCIVGDNGAGKTTLLKALLNMKTIQDGTISFDASLGQNDIGYVSQQNDINKDFPASVYEVVMSGCLNKHGFSPFYHEDEKRRAQEILTRLGLFDIKFQSFQQLSGGQQKRVLLARALLSSSKLLFLDEPVAALDPIATNEFYEVISQLNQEGMTIIMISHDIHSSIHHASHILHLSGSSYFFGTTNDYLTSSFGQTYLGEKGLCRECHHAIHLSNRSTLG
ncbi:MAG: metal ABC transporter ATP-binding protein [Clostridia bacterium]|nr:metal ABC transporter ATP-binding protein [Clostridia bacterium]